MARLVVLLLVLVLLCGHAIGEPACPDVVMKLAPCLDYLRAKEKEPSQACCGGVVELKGMGKSKGDRQAICKCLKEEAGKIKGINAGNAAKLATKCGVKGVPPVTLNTDCSKIP